MKKYMVMYLEEREEDHDWDINLQTDDRKEAIANAKELSEGDNIDGVRVLKTECVYESLNRNSWGRPWSKTRKKKE